MQRGLVRPVQPFTEIPYQGQVCITDAQALSILAQYLPTLTFSPRVRSLATNRQGAKVAKTPSSAALARVASAAASPWHLQPGGPDVPDLAFTAWARRGPRGGPAGRTLGGERRLRDVHAVAWAMALATAGLVGIRPVSQIHFAPCEIPKAPP